MLWYVNLYWLTNYQNDQISNIWSPEYSIGVENLEKSGNGLKVGKVKEICGYWTFAPFELQYWAQESIMLVIVDTYLCVFHIQGLAFLAINTKKF